MFFENVVSLEEALKQSRFPSLETFDCPYNSASTGSGVIRIIFPEFTCVCPKTGYPDFAAIGLYYLPDKLCLELKSWKLYLNAFRMVGTFHETVTWHLFETIKKLLEPKWLLVTGDFYPRGNVDTTVVFEYGNRPDGADLLVGRLEPRFKEAGL
ncbi:MAG: NADPH-dependent 7-cyano-7-deazaguanine reductase QueF [Fibrobacter sp.]|nr:NADPH-dependent 7-cyano-7-deazaguanine reductase QueF [Fibrobacter sp.]